MGQAHFPIREFEKVFPDDDACLDWLFGFLYPAGVHCHVCDRVTTHHKETGRKSYCCARCGHHVHPTAGTIFHKSSTPLKLWFYAMHLVASTRCGISAKQIHREIGVTYKCAHRMFKQIRSMLAENPRMLSGVVETDDTLLYAKPRRFENGMTIIDAKTPIIGAVERGGFIVTEALQPGDKPDVAQFVLDNVEQGSTLYTDESSAYREMFVQYRHRTVVHWKHEYVRGQVHTNTIEGFWGNFKTGFRGVYKHCGDAYLQSYVNEYAFRYNRRKSAAPMFHHFCARIKQLDWWVPYCDRAKTVEHLD